MSNLQQIITEMANLAPHRDAQDWDNIGLQVGDFDSEIKKVLISLDVNEDVLNEAIKKDIDLIISHHPLIFNGIDNVHNQTAKGRIIMQAIKNDVAIYSAHTNMDIAQGGINDLLAKKLNLTQIKLLSKDNEKKLYKLAVYVPENHVENVKNMIFKKGAGKIGNYSKTSFSYKGEGTFLPNKGSNPHFGNQGELTEVNEVKIESVVFEDKIQNVIKGMLKVHPYEEVAYDVYELPLQSEYKGIGRIGLLKEATVLKKYCAHVKDILNVDKLKVRGNLDKMIKKVALCSGSGADYIKLAKAKGADLYITADIKYHEAQLAEEINLNLVDAGHYETEVIFKELVTKYLKKIDKKKGLSIEVLSSEVNTNPWMYL